MDRVVYLTLAKFLMANCFYAGSLFGVQLG